MIASRQVGQAPKSAEQQLDTNTNQLSDLKKAVEENKGKYTNGIKNKIINSIPEKYKNDFNNSIQGHTFNKKINNLELLYLKHTTDADTNKLEIQNILLDYIKSVNNTLLESVTDKAKLLKEVLTDNNINQNLRKQIVNSLITMQDIQRGGLDMAHNTFQTFISLFGGDNPNRISESAKIPLANTVDLILGQLDFNEGFDLCFGENAKKLNNLIESNHKELLGFGIVQLFMDQHKETIKEKMEITIKDSKKADPLNPSLNDLEIKFGDGGDAKLIANDNINRNNLLLYLKINHAYFRQQITPTILAALNSDISLVEREAEMDEQVRQIAKDAGIDLPQGIKHPLRAIISNPVLFLIMLGACIFNSDFRKKFFGPLGLALAIYDFGGGGDLLAGALGGAERTNADLVELMKQGDAWTKEKFNKHITEPLTNLVGINQDQLPPFLQSNERISQNPNTLFAYICADLSFAEINSVNNSEGLRGILDKSGNFKRLVERLDPAETVGLMEMVTIENFRSFKKQTEMQTAITLSPGAQKFIYWLRKNLRPPNAIKTTSDSIKTKDNQASQPSVLQVLDNTLTIQNLDDRDKEPIMSSNNIPGWIKDLVQQDKIISMEYDIENNKIKKLHLDPEAKLDKEALNQISAVVELSISIDKNNLSNITLNKINKFVVYGQNSSYLPKIQEIDELKLINLNSFPDKYNDIKIQKLYIGTGDGIYIANIKNENIKYFGFLFNLDIDDIEWIKREELIVDNNKIKHINTYFNEKIGKEIQNIYSNITNSHPLYDSVSRNPFQLSSTSKTDINLHNIFSLYFADKKIQNITKNTNTILNEIQTEVATYNLELKLDNLDISDEFNKWKQTIINNWILKKDPEATQQDKALIGLYNEEVKQKDKEEKELEEKKKNETLDNAKKEIEDFLASKNITNIINEQRLGTEHRRYLTIIENLEQYIDLNQSQNNIKKQLTILKNLIKIELCFVINNINLKFNQIRINFNKSFLKQILNSNQIKEKIQKMSTTNKNKFNNNIERILKIKNYNDIDLKVNITKLIFTLVNFNDNSHMQKALNISDQIIIKID